MERGRLSNEGLLSRHRLSEDGHHHGHTWAERLSEDISKITPKLSFDGEATWRANPSVVVPKDRNQTGSMQHVHDDRISSDGATFNPLLDGKIEYQDLSEHHDENILQVFNSKALTIFLLINTMIGSGILNQPFVFKRAGVFGGILGYILASVMTWLGLNLLTAAGVKTNIPEYGRLAKYALGAKGEIAIDVSIIVGCFGSLLGYILVVGSTLSQLLISWGCNSIACDLYFTTLLAVGIFVLPICLFRHFGHLAFLSLFSVFTIVMVLGLVIIGGPLQQVPGTVLLFDGTGFVQSLGSIVFSLSCASANFQAYITTEKSSQNRTSWVWITAYVVFIGSLMCASMGVAGYASFKSGTVGIILDNFEGPKFDFFKVMVAGHLILYIPVNFVIMRYSIVKMTTTVKSEQLPWHIHAILSVTMLAGTTGMVLIMNFVGLTSGDAFSLILDITGGIAGSLTSFVLPALIFLAVCDHDDWLMWPARINLFLGVFIMMSVVITTAMNYI